MSELYPGEASDLTAAEAEPLLTRSTTNDMQQQQQQQPARRGTVAVALSTALVVGVCLVSLGVPQHLPRALGSLERRRMLDAFDAAQEGARGEWTDETMHYHEETISPLPLMERLKRHYDVAGHDRHHPQGDTYAPLPRADGRRGLQDDGGGGMLAEESTDPLNIFVDYSNMRPADAMPYATCFNEGDWFKWNFPRDATPPCPNAVNTATRNTWNTWVESNQNSCAGGADVYGPGNLDGQMCNREYDSSSQNCWGVCLKEDVLQTAEQNPCEGATGRDTEFCQHLCDTDKCLNDGGSEWDIGDSCSGTAVEIDGVQVPQCECSDPDYCFMDRWAIKHIEAVVAESEGYLRARKRTSNMALERSVGLYNHIYESKGIATAEQCARDAQLMYRLPVLDSYCTSGFDGDVIFYPVMAQYTPGVGGWGGDAGKDEFGRPIILVMGWSIAYTPVARYHKQVIGAPRSIILHEIVHGLGFSVYNFRDRRDANGDISSMVEERSVPDDTENVWFVTSERTLAIAQDYFGCADLDGLPLMGDNQLGTGSRGSHWETRIMNDEFMAYGDGSLVSGMTIAMFEDLGFYLGDYTNADCMHWGKKQGCEFVRTRCAARKLFDPDDSDNIVLNEDGRTNEGCNRHWKSGTGVAWATSAGGDDREADLAGWNNGIRSASGSCSSARANSIVERYCVASNCRQQWPGMVRATDDDNPPIALSSGRPLWSCSISSSNIEYEGYQYVCPPGETCQCSAECQTTNPASGEYWGPAPDDCAAVLGPVSAASSRGGLGAFFDNPIEDYPLIIASAMAVLALSFVTCVARCVKTARFSCLVGTSIFIFVIFIIASISMLAMTIYAYFFFENLDEIVSQNAWSYLIGLAGGVLVFSIYGTLSVCLVARETGCCKQCKCAIGIFSALLFLVIVMQTLGTFVALFWIKDSYSHSEGQFTTRGQMEGEMEKTRTGIAFIDDSLDKAIRDIEAVTCNSYKKCCYTIAEPPANHTSTGPERVEGVVYLAEGAPCDLISDAPGQCNPGLDDEVTGEATAALVCTPDDRNAAAYETLCEAEGSSGDCSLVVEADNANLKLCEWDPSGASGAGSCEPREAGTCRPTIVDADSSFTCVGAHAGSGVGAAVSALNDPSNPGFCQLLSGNNRKGITPTGALCYAMEEVGVLRGLRPDGPDEDNLGDGSLETCAADFCDSGVSGFELYVSGIFGWVHDKVVPIGVMTGLLGMLEFAQLCVCLGMLCTHPDNLTKGYNEAAQNVRQRSQNARRSIGGGGGGGKGGRGPDAGPAQAGYGDETAAPRRRTVTVDL
jgi:hypothetical protein